MSRFSNFANGTQQTSTGANLTVMVRQANLWGNLSTLVSEHLEKALKCLARTDGLLRERKLNASLVGYANTYFLTGPKTIASSDLAYIQAVVTRVWNGLGGDVTIKTGNLVGHGDRDVWGEVRKSAPLTGLALVAKPRRPYYTSVTGLDGSCPNWDGRAIKIDEAALTNAQIGTQALLHEASHKYAGTIDYCYFDDTGITPRGPFTDKKKAMMNADSYGYFILKAGRL